MSSTEFSTAVSVMSIGGIIMQIPSNMLLTRVRPSIYLPGAAVILGLLSLCTGLVRSAGALITIRLILGCVEVSDFMDISSRVVTDLQCTGCLHS